MAAADTVKQVKNIIDDITKDPIDSLVTNRDWGRLNFEGARQDLGLIVGIATQLKNLPLELLPDGEINPIRDALTPIAAQIGLMRAFTVEQGNAPGQRDAVINAIHGQVPSLYAQAQLRAPFLAFQRGNIRQNEERFAKVVRDADYLLVSARTHAESKRAEVDKIIAAAREASASVGVATYTSDFSGAADAMDHAAKIWLWATAVFGGATVGLALAFPFIYPVTDAAFHLQAVQVYTSKLIALGVLFTATIWCGRLYKASKHQEMVNRHRANALKTFQAFVKSSSDDQTRNAVLLEATRSIFALASSGYLDGAEAAQGNGAIKILEVIKSATTAAKT